MSKLAIHGGPKAVGDGRPDTWLKVSDAERAEVLKQLDAQVITIGAGGGIIGEFEDLFKQYVGGAKYALAQCNGTSTLHAAYFAVGVKPGTEVVITPYTWHASITPIIHCGGVPVFCEIDPVNLCADPKDVAKRITSKTKAISVTHVWGNVTNMDGILEVAREHNLPVIEDCSHAHGATWDGKHVGTLGDIGCFSMQGQKAVTGGEAGVVITDNQDYYEKMLILGHYGRVAAGLETDRFRNLDNMGIGVKYRAHPWAIAMAKAGLGRLDELNEQRRKHYATFNDGVRDLPGVETSEPLPKAQRGGYLEFKVKVKPDELMGVTRERIVEALAAEGTACTVDRYGCWHKHPLFNDYDFSELGGVFYDPTLAPDGRMPKRYGSGSLPITEATCETIISVPAFTHPDEGVVEQYVEAFRKVFQNLETLR